MTMALARDFGVCWLLMKRLDPWLTHDCREPRSNEAGPFASRLHGNLRGSLGATTFPSYGSWVRSPSPAPILPKTYDGILMALGRPCPRNVRVMCSAGVHAASPHTTITASLAAGTARARTTTARRGGASGTNGQLGSTPSLLRGRLPLVPGGTVWTAATKTIAGNDEMMTTPDKSTCAPRSGVLIARGETRTRFISP